MRQDANGEYGTGAVPVSRARLKQDSRAASCRAKLRLRLPAIGLPTNSACVPLRSSFSKQNRHYVFSNRSSATNLYVFYGIL